jgi:cell division protein FtsA
MNNEKSKYVAAIDIGTTKIVALLGERKENGKINILALSKTASKGVKRGVVSNIEETVSVISKIVKEVQDTSGINMKDIFVGIAGQHIKSIQNRGYKHWDSYDHEITREDIDAIVDDMYKIPIEVGEEIIHVLPQNFIVDNETGVKNPIGMSGKRLEANFHIVIGQVASAKNIEKCVNRVGMQINELILEPLASSASVLTEDEKEAGVVLVDVGGGTTDVAVFYDGIIRHTAVIPFGGNVITTDIKEGCAILQRQAEALKIQFGSALGDIAPSDKVVTIPGISGREPKEISFQNLAYIIQSRMEEIIDAVTFDIENSGYMDKLSAGIVITGGGSLLKHLPQLVKYRTGMDVRVGFPNEYLTSDYKEDENHPMYSTSIGLLLKGMEFQDRNKQRGSQLEENKANKPGDEGGIKLKTRPKSKIFDSVIQRLSNIFEENDAEM